MTRAVLLSLALTATLIVAARSSGVLEQAGKNGCRKLVEIVSKAGLRSALESAKDITLFAPTDAAFSSIPDDVMKALSANATLLQDVLKFHVVSQVKMSGDLKNDELLPTLSGNLKLRTNIYKNGKVITAEGSPVSKADLKASNGVVHVIDKVIYPLPTLSIPLVLTFDKDLNNLGFLAYQAKLINNLTQQGLTLFAPSNEAIKKLPGQEYNDLLMNFTELTSVVTFHVVNKTMFSSSLEDGQMLTTLEGQQLTVKIASGVVTVNGAKVTQADLSASNGVIHVIDTLLFPPKPPTTKLYDILIPIIG